MVSFADFGLVALAPGRTPIRRLEFAKRLIHVKSHAKVRHYLKVSTAHKIS